MNGKDVILGREARLGLLDGVNQLVHFLPSIEPNAPVLLLPIPRTPIRRAQSRHYLQQIIDGGLLNLVFSARHYNTTK